MARMLGRFAKRKVCNCNKHHRPTISWGKRARHAARAKEKSDLRKIVNEK